MHPSTILRAKAVKEELYQYYERGNQSKSKKAIWRHKIKPKFGISYRTLLYYLSIA